MRLFEFLEAFNNEINIQMYDSVSDKILYDGDIEDIPHKIASKRDIVLGTVEIKNGVLQVYTQKCEEFDY